ncbi:MAG: MauE/DoxX family redox-associated membrane protein [Pseudomonadota bacterium]
MNLDPVLTMLPSAFFALLFGIGASHKLLSWRLFQQQVADYRVLPRALNTPAAVVLPLCEALLSLAWLDGASRPFAAPLSALLLAAYAGAMAWNLRLGRDTIDCGCGGADGSQVIRWALVWRNAALAALALLLSASANEAARELGWVDWLSVDAGALALMGMYFAVNQIFANLPPQRVLD